LFVCVLPQAQLSAAIDNEEFDSADALNAEIETIDATLSSLGV
jgi:hypothetical protein